MKQCPNCNCENVVDSDSFRCGSVRLNGQFLQTDRCRLNCAVAEIRRLNADRADLREQIIAAGKQEMQLRHAMQSLREKSAQATETVSEIEGACSRCGSSIMRQTSFFCPSCDGVQNLRHAIDNLKRLNRSLQYRVNLHKDRYEALFSRLEWVNHNGGMAYILRDVNYGEIPKVLEQATRKARHDESNDE